GNPLMPSVSCSSYSALASKPPFFLTTTLAPSKYHSTSVGVSSESSVEVSNNVSSTLMVEGSNGALKCRVIASLESMYSPSGGYTDNTLGPEADSQSFRASTCWANTSAISLCGYDFIWKLKNPKATSVPNTSGSTMPTASICMLLPSRLAMPFSSTCSKFWLSEALGDMPSVVMARSINSFTCFGASGSEL